MSTKGKMESSSQRLCGFSEKIQQFDKTPIRSYSFTLMNGLNNEEINNLFQYDPVE